MLTDDWSPTPDAPTTDFTTALDGTLHLTAELARRLIGAHQAAASLVVRENWQGMRKYFSLSPKYAAWYHYRIPAVGFGIHADIVMKNTSMETIPKRGQTERLLCSIWPLSTNGTKYNDKRMG